MSHLTTADLIFSEQANHNFSEILGDLKRSTLSIRNRLRSIRSDADFVLRVAHAYPSASLVANERCGSWYIPPARKRGSAYFKSTDGHTGIWFFSTRRLNLQLLDLLSESNGVIVVDSTRRGKRMPDALSKTIPIWCCVLNRALFPEKTGSHDLYTPPLVVSPSEHSQIVARIPALVESLVALGLDLKELRAKIQMPMRPVWVTPESSLDVGHPIFEEFHPIICCTASRRVTGTEVSEGGYIQGAGDDTENWAYGLTPDIFWANTEHLQSLSDEDLPSTIEQLVAAHAASPSTHALPPPITPDTSLIITTNSTLQSTPQIPGTLHIHLLPEPTPAETWHTPNSLTIGLGAHKLGSRNLRSAFPHITAFLQTHLSQAHATPTTICISCSTGLDFSIGVALVVLCLFYDEAHRQCGWQVVRDAPRLVVDKGFVRRRLGWLMIALPHANPSRATLQSVNSFLMERPA